jgi:hypothetical protein
MLGVHQPMVCPKCPAQVPPYPGQAVAAPPTGHAHAEAASCTWADSTNMQCTGVYAPTICPNIGQHMLGSACKHSVAVGSSCETHFVYVEPQCPQLGTGSLNAAGALQRQPALLQITWIKMHQPWLVFGPECAEMQPPEFCPKVLEGGRIPTVSACLITIAGFISFDANA